MRCAITVLAGAAIVTAVFLASGCGQTTRADPVEPHPLSEHGTLTDARLRDLAFMSGCWSMYDKEHYSEEWWSAPAGKCMSGAFRIVKPDGSVALYEMLSISAEPDGVVMRLRHFDSGMMPWKSEAEGPIVLKLETLEQTRGIFRPNSEANGSPSFKADIHTAVFRRVSGSGTLGTITYERIRDTMRTAVAFTPESKREPLRFEMRRVTDGPN